MRQCLSVVFAALLAVATHLEANGQPISLGPDAQIVRGGDYRLSMRVFKNKKLTERPILLVRSKPDYQYAFAAKAAETNSNVIAVAILRPGYSDPQGSTSDGERGQMTGDNYNARNTDAIAGAIGELKRHFLARKVVVAGHSGGAAITANILGRHPDLIDAALLVSCPGDVEKWRQHKLEITGNRIWGAKVDTLSPIGQITGISKQAKITMIVGTQDTNTPPSLSESYLAEARKQGKNVRLIRLKGKEHDIFLESAVFGELTKILK